MKKILMIAPKTNTFVNFRGDLIKDIKKLGYKITVIVPENDCEDFFKENDVDVRLIDLDKNSTSVLKTISYYNNLKRIIKEEKPDKVFSYTIKPVIFGSIAAQKAKVKEIYSLICGLGYLFSVNSLKVRILRKICGVAYKYALKYNSKVIFQNSDDIDEFVKRNYIKKEKCELVNGSGVNIEKFRRNDLPKDLSFLMVARVLKEKGVMEYFEAAKVIKEKYADIKFSYIGAIDKNKNAINFDVLKPYIEKGIVNYIPETDHVERYLEECTVFVLPSYYREGIPRTLIEATAMGRPIITTNTPGCRETVIDGKNGYFVKEKNIEDLVNKMIYLIEHKDKLIEMGDISYKICMDKFTIDKIDKEMMRIMRI